MSADALGASVHPWAPTDVVVQGPPKQRLTLLPPLIGNVDAMSIVDIGRAADVSGACAAPCTLVYDHLIGRESTLLRLASCNRQTNRQSHRQHCCCQGHCALLCLSCRPQSHMLQLQHTFPIQPKSISSNVCLAFCASSHHSKGLKRCCCAWAGDHTGNALP